MFGEALEDAKKNSTTEVKNIETIKHINEWQAILSNLNKKEKRAALIAIEKWHGASHEKAYTTVFGKKEH